MQITTSTRIKNNTNGLILCVVSVSDDGVTLKELGKAPSLKTQAFISNAELNTYVKREIYTIL